MILTAIILNISTAVDSSIGYKQKEEPLTHTPSPIITKQGKPESRSPGSRDAKRENYEDRISMSTSVFSVHRSSKSSMLPIMLISLLAGFQ